MHNFLHLFISILCLCIIGCSYTPNELKTAEQLMETAPDSSLQILRKLQIKKSVALITLYALLMSQALKKNNIKIETDSLTSIATYYFDDSDPVHAGYASNRNSVNEQAKNLLKAQEYFEKTNDNKRRWLIFAKK